MPNTTPATSPHAQPQDDTPGLGKRRGIFCEKTYGEDASKEKRALLAYEAGSEDPKCPALIMVGGLRGDSPCGSLLVESMMEAVSRSASESSTLAGILSTTRLVFIPAANPWGLAHKSRFNSRGVELGRDSEVQAEGPTPFFLGGHRLLPWLPGYRGRKRIGMQPETRALLDLVMEHANARRCTIVVHAEAFSGRGSRLWFPFESSHEPMPWLPLMLRLRARLAGTFSSDGYGIEPIFRRGLAHGSLWDQSLAEARFKNLGEGRFIPLTLGVGKKNWREKPTPPDWLSIPNPGPGLAAFLGHARLAEFLMLAASDSPHWTDIDPSERSSLLVSALDLWWPASLNDKG